MLWVHGGGIQSPICCRIRPQINSAQCIASTVGKVVLLAIYVNWLDWQIFIFENQI